MKRRTLTLTLCLFSLITLFSVGFAAWVITGGTTTDAQGSISASTVTDKSLNLKDEMWSQGGVTLGDTDGTLNEPTIVFGRPADSTLKETDWLRWTVTDGNPDVPVEEMEATYSFTLYSESDLKDVYTGSEVTFTEPEVVKNCTYVTSTVTYSLKVGTADAVVYETTTLLDEAIKNTSEGVKEVKIAVIIEYKWVLGATNKNPFVYFNEISKPTQEQKTAAKSALDAVYALMGQEYQLSIVLSATNN